MLSTHAVAKSFQGYPIVHGLNLSVSGGEIVALLGPNGAGKTTSFRLLAGIEIPDRGTIELDGRDITAMTFSDRALLGVSYLPQESAIFRGLTLEQNFQIVLEARHSSSTVQRETMLQFLDEFCLAHLRGRIAGTLSGGERRRAELALIMACDPKFLLLDEPFAGLDPISVNEIQSSIGKLTKRGIGFLIADHNARELLRITDRAYVISAGCLLAHGSANTILQNPDVRQIYFGEEFRA